MMDHFKEDVVISHNRLVPNILYAICWVFIVAFGLFALLSFEMVFMSFSVGTLLLMLLSGGAAFSLFLFKDNLKLEYEYTFTNGSLDFAKVLRSARRKELGSMNVQNVAACGHVAHESFRKFLAMPDVSKKNWFLNRDGNLFYFYYEKENKKHMIIIEPSEEMVEMIRAYVPAGVYRG